jgi:hypothetical protein
MSEIRKNWEANREMDVAIVGPEDISKIVSS